MAFNLKNTRRFHSQEGMQFINSHRLEKAGRERTLFEFP